MEPSPNKLNKDQNYKGNMSLRTYHGFKMIPSLDNIAMSAERRHGGTNESQLFKPAQPCIFPSDFDEDDYYFSEDLCQASKRLTNLMQQQPSRLTQVHGGDAKNLQVFKSSAFHQKTENRILHSNVNQDKILTPEHTQQKPGKALWQTGTFQQVCAPAGAILRADEAAGLRIPFLRERSPKSPKDVCELAMSNHAMRVEADEAAEAAFSQMWPQQKLQQVMNCDSEPQQLSSTEQDKEPLAAEVEQLSETLQRTKALHDGAFMTYLNRFRDLKLLTMVVSEIKSKIKNAEMSEGTLHKQKESQTDQEICLALCNEKNDQMAEGVMDKIHNLREQLTNVTAEKEAAVVQAQEETERRRDLEENLAKQTEENKIIKAAVVEAKKMIEHLLRRQEELIQLRLDNNDLSNTLVEKETALEHVMDKLHLLEEQLVTIKAEKKAAQTQIMIYEYQLHSQKRLLELCRYNSDLSHTLVKIVLQDLSDKVHKVEELLIKITAKKEAAILQAQVEMQSQRDVEGCPSMQPEEKNKIKFGIIHAKMAVDSDSNSTNYIDSKDGVCNDTNNLECYMPKAQVHKPTEIGEEPQEMDQEDCANLAQFSTHLPEEAHPVKIISVEEAAVVPAQGEIQDQGELEACLTEERAHEKASVAQVGTEVEHQQLQGQEELKLCQDHSELSHLPLEKDQALEGAIGDLKLVKVEEAVVPSPKSLMGNEAALV